MGTSLIESTGRQVSAARVWADAYAGGLPRAAERSGVLDVTAAVGTAVVLAGRPKFIDEPTAALALADLVRSGTVVEILTPGGAVLARKGGA